jgi:hypothetical protein
MVSMDACSDVYRLAKAKRWSRLLESISTLLVVAKKPMNSPGTIHPGEPGSEPMARVIHPSKGHASG